MLIPSAQSLLKKYGIHPKKRLGQHFLSARPTMEKVVGSLDAKSDDVVLEIGPGLGLMTALIAPIVKKVVAVDADRSLLDIARAEFGGLKNIDWLRADILDFDVAKITPARGFGEKIKIIGNLPYNISSPIIFWMMNNRRYISCAVIMIQKEVADRLISGPGSKDYGILSVLLGALADCKKLFDVKATNFIPPPEVTSTVVRIDFKDHESDVTDEAWFRLIVKGAFGQRRKTLRNALLGCRALMLDAKKLDAALVDCKIDGTRRPEALGIGEFLKLAAHLK